MFSPTPPGLFICATQDGVVRLNPAVDRAAGLCTDNLRCCLGIIFVGKNGKISLTHTDFTTDADSIIAEAKWVGDIAKFYLIKIPGLTNT